MPALEQREFDTWREGDAEFKQQMLEHIKAQTELNLSVQGRLTTVENEQGKSGRRTTWVSSTISAIIAAIIGAIAGAGSR